MKKRFFFSASFALFVAAPAFSQDMPHKMINDDALMPGTHNSEHNWSKRTREESGKEAAQKTDPDQSSLYKLNSRQVYIQKYKNDYAYAISKTSDLHLQANRTRLGIFSPEYFLFTK